MTTPRQTTAREAADVIEAEIAAAPEEFDTYEEARLCRVAIIERHIAARDQSRPRYAEGVIEQICREVAELPDRTSPDDAPHMMLVSSEELASILRSVTPSLTYADGELEQAVTVALRRGASEGRPIPPCQCFPPGDYDMRKIFTQRAKCNGVCADAVGSVVAAIRALSDAPPDWTPTHRHYKGGLYRVVGRARHSETLEVLVIYENSRGERWARPEPMFLGVLADGTRRFECIDTQTRDITPSEVRVFDAALKDAVTVIHPGERASARDGIIDLVLRQVAELPDRTSPPDAPEMMLVSADELTDALNHAFDAAAAYSPDQRIDTQPKTDDGERGA